MIGLGLPLRTVEAEWGPGQLEITLDPLSDVAAADAMIHAAHGGEAGGAAPGPGRDVS